MNLFSKEKDLIFKITNMVLVIWFVVGVVLFWVQLTNVILRTETMTYEVYRSRNCNNYYECEDCEGIQSPKYYVNCEEEYDNYVYYSEDNEREDLKQLFIFFGNALIVSGVIYFINRRNK